MNKIFLIIPILVNFCAYGMVEEFLELETTENFVWPENLTESVTEQVQDENLQEEDVIEFGENGQKNKCYVCGDVLPSLKELRFHSKTHLYKDEYICNHPECNSSFKKFSSLNAHIYVKHTDEKPFKCSYCSKAFKRNYYLINHMRIHTGDKPYKCNYCEYAGKQIGALQTHIANVHSIDKPYKCDICEYSTKSKESLKDHIKAHENKKGYKCNYSGCNKAFNQASGLLVHAKIHLGSYSCTKCNKAFGSKNIWEAHMNAHKGLKPYLCPHGMCSFSTNGKNNLTKHINNTHSGDKKRLHSEILKTDKELDLKKPKAKRIKR